MKKVFGLQAEVNLTADEEICKGIGKGLSKGSITLDDIIKEVKPEIIKGIKQLFEDKPKKEENNNTK